MKKALGLIETIGLVGAIEAADAAVKAADIVLLGYENTRGAGKITVKMAGHVGAVKAGVAAGVAAAARVGQVYGQRVIPRPHDEIDALIRNLDRGRGLSEEKKVAMETAVSLPEDKPESAPADKTPCAAITKSGEPCKLPAQPGTQYCFVHRNQAEE
ncbi:MAG: microcompartment protein [Chloroflexi bacterium]|nr:MAG: microcompartment protein [Chloroflexota bacterium]